MPTTLRINDFALEPSSIRTIPFHGTLSGKDLPAMLLNFDVSGAKSVDVIENLLDQKTVRVDDPFNKQVYQASFTRISSSYSDSRPEHSYTCEIKALDIAPEYSVLEIEGEKFPVLMAQEDVIPEEQEGIMREILLRLTHDQFITVQEFLKRDALSIKRIGVDESPLRVRHGSAMYWSRHVEGNEIFYKQIVRFIQPSNFPSSKINVALGTDHDILVGMVLALSTRFERLADELVESGAISTEKQALLLGDDWKNLLNEQRIDKIVQQKDRVLDAEEEI